MTFTSYAQNFEDVMLWRALKHIENGFYIDIGAAWPEEHSVTLAFYEKNWSGINIEPNPVHYESLLKKRTRDINLKLAIDNQKETSVTINFFLDTGLSTLDNKIAEQHINEGFSVIKEDIKVETLSSICQQYLKPAQDIHFLKIDVEGSELPVIRSNDWSRYRPWILVIEATLPMSQEENYSIWESLLLKNDYIFAYADGLNRFYVSKEHSELLNFFKYPPNVFDEFELISQKNADYRANEAESRANEAESRANEAKSRANEAESRAKEAESRANEAESRANEAKSRANEAESRANEAESRAKEAESRAKEAEFNSEKINERLVNILHSRSWRITAPIRRLSNLLRTGKL